MTKDSLALEGGSPVRKTLLPYSRQNISDADVQAVEKVLRSDWLTTGPTVRAFEEAFESFVSAKEAVAVSSGTAALHAAMYALGIDKDDEVIVPAMTFAATANAVVFQGGTPRFADCNPTTLLIDPESVERLITKNTKAVIAVDYAGQPCDYSALRTLAEKHSLVLVADACHALGAYDGNAPVGSVADLSAFSFHPVKPITTGEGGIITTDHADWAEACRRFRNHCMTSDHREREEKGSWFYEINDLGYNYRITDFQCALGMSQLQNVTAWTAYKEKLSRKYDEAFASLSGVTPLARRPNTTHAHHLYVVQFELNTDRQKIFQALRAENIGVNVHYIPVHYHPFYRKNYGTKEGICPHVEAAYEKIISLPLFAGMNENDADDVIAAVQKVCTHYAQ